MTGSVGVYVHVPFCTARCHYCDFNTYAGLNRLFGTYVDAMCAHIARLPQHFVTTDAIEVDARDLRARTIFFGGGTPTLLEPEAIERILEAVRQRMSVGDDIEISIEANPGTVAEGHLARLRAMGINRISFGVQTFDPTLLSVLGRIHTAEQAERARRVARSAGFESTNLDFIYGLPDQTLSMWRETLERAIALRPEHLSLYSLTVESGTVFHRRHERGQLPLPDEDLVADMYDLATDELTRAGYQQYEISNWAINDRHQCQHNLGYWNNLEYLGIGPGAHSWFGGKRYVETLSPAGWANQIAAMLPPIQSVETLSLGDTIGETLMLGLRLLDGINLNLLSQRFGVDLAAALRKPISETKELGLLEVDGAHLRLTPRARLIGNEVFRRFLDAGLHAFDTPPVETAPSR